MREAQSQAGPKTKRKDTRMLRLLLRKQAEIRRFRGKLRWQGDLGAMRSDR